VVHEERLLEDLGARIRDVRNGPDDANGSLLRLEPAL
jgi:glucose/arabinose dehydrogenase